MSPLTGSGVAGSVAWLASTLRGMNAYETVLSGQRAVRYAVAYNRDHFAASVNSRMVLLAAGALTDMALMDPNGYSGTSAHDIADVTGLGIGEVEQELRALTDSGVFFIAAGVPVRFRFPNRVLDPANEDD